MVVLREILMSSVRAGDPLAAWSAAARLLRSFYPLITPAGQSGLASSLMNSAERLPPGTRSADPALPFVRSSSFLITQPLFLLNDFLWKSFYLVLSFTYQNLGHHSCDFFLTIFRRPHRYGF